MYTCAVNTVEAQLPLTRSACYRKHLLLAMSIEVVRVSCLCYRKVFIFLGSLFLKNELQFLDAIVTCVTFFALMIRRLKVY